ncbi:MAG TPA: hypothetical protein VNK49_03170 [Anaerolineales bacterium]|nr:hypothetical protein [Anaerolineales bacterium]
MEGLNFAPILIPLLALFIGWVIGFFDSNLRTSKKIKEAEAAAQAAIKDAQEKIAEAEARLASIPQEPTRADDPGILRIKNENGTLTLDLDGTRVNAASITPAQRKRLIEILTYLRPWLEGRPAPINAPAAPSASLSPPHPVPVSPTPPTPTSAQAPTPKKETEPEATPTSLVGQINAILQKQIANTPLASKGIILMESPSGGVNVYVGINKYEGIDQVPNEEIKAAIRAAIAEWEKKYTPGL